MRVNRAPWTSASFVMYAGALLALFGSLTWLIVISSDHGGGAFAGWSVLFWAVCEVVALWLLVSSRPVTAGLFAFVGIALWAVMIGSFFSWWGWLHNTESPFDGFHVGNLALELLIFLAAIVDLKIWRFPLLVLPAAGAAWFFVTDFVSSGGNWTNVVTLLIGFLYFLIALAIDGGDTRPYGFWVHVLAGLLIGGVFLDWWHSSDAQWAGIIIISLLFIMIAAGIRRSSYAVLGTVGLILATGHYTSSSLIDSIANQETPTTWAPPVGYLCLGLFLALLGTGLYRARTDTE